MEPMPNESTAGALADVADAFVNPRPTRLAAVDRAIDSGAGWPEIAKAMGGKTRQAAQAWYANNGGTKEVRRGRPPT